jgi:hypothetical protein
LRHAAAQTPRHGILATVVSAKHLFEEQAQRDQWRVDTFTLVCAVQAYQVLQLRGIEQAAQCLGAGLCKSTEKLANLAPPQRLNT